MTARDDLFVGNVVENGIWEAEIPKEVMKADKVTVKICTHERLNDNGDACLDCGAVYSVPLGKWF